MEEGNDGIPQIKTGSVVRLKSGGPLMTVAGYYRTWWKVYKDEIMCDWIDEGGYPRNTVYFIEQLKVEHI